MRTRPFILILITILFCLEPAAKVLFSAFWDHVNWYVLLEYQFYKLSYLDWLLTFALLPITGVVIYLAKKWSYLFFILVEVYMISLHGSVFLVGEYTPNEPPFVFNLSFFILHCGVLFYFLTSNIRLVFIKTSLRFWETDPRYQSSIAVRVFKGDEEIGSNSQLVDISKSGAFISNIADIDVNSEVLIKFTIGSDDFKFDAITVHKSKIRNIGGYGAKFINLTDIKKMQIAFLIKTHASESNLLRNERDIIGKIIFSLINFVKKISKLVFCKFKIQRIL